MATDKRALACLSAPAAGGRDKPTVGASVLFRPFCAKRRRGGFFFAPSARANAVIHDSNRNAVGFCDLSPRGVLVSHSHNRSIPRLLLVACPPAVLWGVPHGIVFPVDSEARRVTSGHCPIVKGLEIKPLIAHSDSLPAVVLIGFITAAFLHVFPAHVKRRFGQSMRRRSGTNCVPGGFASTRLAFAASEVRANHDFYGPALAGASPQRGPTFGVSFLTQNEPGPKRQSRNINKTRIFSHG